MAKVDQVLFRRAHALKRNGVKRSEISGMLHVSDRTLDRWFSPVWIKKANLGHLVGSLWSEAAPEIRHRAVHNFLCHCETRAVNGHDAYLWWAPMNLYQSSLIDSVVQDTPRLSEQVEAFEEAVRNKDLARACRIYDFLKQALPPLASV